MRFGRSVPAIRGIAALRQRAEPHEGSLTMLAALQSQLPSWEARDVHTWSPDQPRPLRTTWDGTGLQRGQIRVNGAPFSISEINANNRLKAWGVAGRTQFERGANRAPGWYPEGACRSSTSAFIQLGLPKVGTDADGMQLGEDVVNMIGEAPPWLRDYQIPVKWEPLAVGEEIESHSTVCIRLLQIHKWVGKSERRTRREVRNETVSVLNHIRQLCCPNVEAYTAADVDFVGFTDEKGMMEGMISIGKRDEMSFDDDCLVGVILAFFIGHRVREGRLQGLHWCLARCELGSSSCVIKSITVANHFHGRSRRQVVFGTQWPGRATWVINNGRDVTVRRIAAVLGKTGSTEALLARLKHRKWDKTSTVCFFCSKIPKQKSENMQF